jgi:26S proteasome regulatory subunit N5
MSDGTLFKPKKDFTKEADKAIPEAQEIAKVCGLSFSAAEDRSLLLRQMCKEV